MVVSYLAVHLLISSYLPMMANDNAAKTVNLKSSLKPFAVDVLRRFAIIMQMVYITRVACIMYIVHVYCVY